VLVRLLKRLGLAVFGGAAAAALWTLACGLPAGGLAAESSDATGMSAPCADAIDAACLGPLPPGWQPVTLGDAGCGTGFETVELRSNPRLEDGGCMCGACQITGSFSCAGPVPISGGDNCGDPPFLTAMPGLCATGQAQHVAAHPPDASGAVGCFAPNDAGAGVATDPFVVCVPGCSADFCSSPQPCVISEGDVACPDGFHLFAHAGTGAAPGCAPCPCEAGPPGVCGGSVTVFDDPSCDSGTSATYPVGTCNIFGNGYKSALVELVPPDASCWPALPAPDPGDASLLGVRTVCCR
jgi:hypothetical protein